MTNGNQVESISVAEAAEKLAAGEAQCVDVRMPFQFAGGRIKGALNFPNTAIQVRGREAPKDKALIFYSDDGVLSARISALARSIGYETVYNLEGGLDAWTDAGYPVETITEGLTSST
jgi:rhodanese-related sulfurtransferase